MVNSQIVVNRLTTIALYNNIIINLLLKKHTLVKWLEYGYNMLLLLNDCRSMKYFIVIETCKNWCLSSHMCLTLTTPGKQEKVIIVIGVDRLADVRDERNVRSQLRHSSQI